MDKIIVKPGFLKGNVEAPASKSFAHRALLCAMLSGAACEIGNVDMSSDIEATMGCVEELGAKCTYDEQKRVIFIDSRKELDFNKTYNLDCRESGSTLRFLLPIVSSLGVKGYFSGQGRLPERPLDMFADIFINQPGIVFRATNDKLPATVEGKLQSGIFEVSGEVSSQHLSGLLMALPMLEGDSEIILKSELQSAAYVAITISVMKSFGVDVAATNHGYKVKGGQAYYATRYDVEADYSQAAFWMVAGSISGDVTIKGLKLDSVQGDRAMIKLLEQFGSEVEFTEEGIRITREYPLLRNRVIDASQIPDLVPIIASLAAFTPGKTTINNAARLRCKESDRLAAVADGLNKIGASVVEKADGLEIIGTDNLQGGAEVNSYNDHRIVMALAIAALKCKYEVTINDYKCIDKSYPKFFEHFNMLGGVTDGINVG